MLKMTGSSNEPTSSKNNGSRSASNRNNNSRPAFGKNDGNSKVDGFGSNGVEHTKKSGKLKGKKSAKFQKSSKFKGKKSKKSAKSGNSSNFSITESGPSFLIPKARTTFNCLRLAFTKAPIL